MNRAEKGRKRKFMYSNNLQLERQIHNTGMKHALYINEFPVIQA